MLHDTEVSMKHAGVSIKKINNTLNTQCSQNINSATMSKNTIQERIKK